MDLSGTWRGAPADEALRRTFHQPHFVDDDWERVPVPGHWTSVPALSDETSILCRHAFEHAVPSDTARRIWLELDGIFYQGDVYLDGEYLGDTEGYFIRHAFDVTDALMARTEHELAIEVNCSPAGSGGKRRSLLGVFEGGTDMVPSGNPGGIWAPVRLRHTGAVRIHGVRAICLEAKPDRATIGVRATLISSSARTVHLITEVGGVEHRADHPLAEGHNEVEWRVEVPDPELWWPHRLGAQPLYELQVRAETRTDEISDQHGLRIGFRDVSVRKWHTYVNGQRMFLKGANLAPASSQLAEATVRNIRQQLEQASDAGLDLVRPYAHVAPDIFYDLADEMGFLVWQDLPLLGPASNGLRGQAVRQARAMVDQLGHHASIYTWNAHVSPAPEWMEATPRRAGRVAGKLAAHQLPTWTKSVLDRSIKRTFRSQDASRNATGFTGVLPHLPTLESSATHLWFGWRRGTERDLPDFAARWPSQSAFVAEFGAQSVPDDAPFIDNEAWPDIGWSDLAEHHGFEEASFARYVPPHGHTSFQSWRHATQLYQAGLLRRQIESLRRLKYAPTGGFCVHYLADTAPSVSASLIDHAGNPKLAYDAVRDACAPVIVVADRLPARLLPGETLASDIHVVSDLDHKLEGAEVEAELRWPGGTHRWRFAGDVDADSVQRIGTLSWVVPDVTGLTTLTIRLGGPIAAVNRYDATIRP